MYIKLTDYGYGIFRNGYLIIECATESECLEYLKGKGN